MIIGISFVAISIFIYIKENYNIDIIEGEKEFTKKTDLNNDRNYKYKMLIAIFSLILGVFRFLNIIIY